LNKRNESELNELIYYVKYTSICRF